VAAIEVHFPEELGKIRRRYNIATPAKRSNGLKWTSDAWVKYSLAAVSVDLLRPGPSGSMSLPILDLLHCGVTWDGA
jgi:hypothetical protein